MVMGSRLEPNESAPSKGWAFGAARPSGGRVAARASSARLHRGNRPINVTASRTAPALQRCVVPSLFHEGGLDFHGHLVQEGQTLGIDVDLHAVAVHFERFPRNLNRPGRSNRFALLIVNRALGTPRVIRQAVFNIASQLDARDFAPLQDDATFRAT